MHETVQQRALEQEKKITAEVRSHMTPEQIAKVDADAKKYAEGVEEARTIHNPYGTGEGFKVPPPPSDDLAKYWRLIQQQTDVDTFH
jgi:molybdopterin-biosynthesis enzyme MoeA-like protein